MTTYVRNAVEKIRLRSAFYWLLVILVTVGAILEVAAAYVATIAAHSSVTSLIAHELLWLVIGGLAFVVMQAVPLKVWLKLSPLFLLLAAGMLLAVMVPGVGRSVGGADRWFQLGPIQVQPSEFAKLALVLFLANLVAKRRPTQLVGPVIVVTALMAGVIFLEPDMGTAMIVFSLGLAALYVGEVRGRALTVVTGGSVLVGIIGAFSSNYRRLRLLSFLNPWKYRMSYSYQEVQALNSFASGHLLGTGLGTGLANWGYVPNAQTDFIFAVVGQDFGLLGSVVILLLLVSLATVIFRVSEQLTQPSERALTFLIAVWLLVQMTLNIGAVIGLLPVTGVPLPLISAGGSSTVVTLAALGLVSGIFRRRKLT
jgi:cell division protein FtsW